MRKLHQQRELVRRHIETFGNQAIFLEFLGKNAFEPPVREGVATVVNAVEMHLDIDAESTRTITIPIMYGES